MELKQDVEEGIGEANTDKARVQQMVINLLSNAIKFTDSGVIIVRGTAAPLDITLPSASAKATADRSADPLGDTDRERNANADRLSAGVSADSPPAEELVISVSDAGKGIPAEELPIYSMNTVRSKGRKAAFKGNRSGSIDYEEVCGTAGRDDQCRK